MVWFNYYSVPAFYYRQLFVTPPPPPPSLNLKGKCGLITGAETGLGYAAAQQLLNYGLSHLILAVRNRVDGEQARQSLFASLLAEMAGTEPVIEIWELELLKYDSIISFSEQLKTSNPRLDFAILNAGVIKTNFETSPYTGNEATIQINWLSTALLTLLLLSFLDEQASHSPTLPPPVLSIIGSETGGLAAFRERHAAKEQGRSILSILNQENLSNLSDRYGTSKLLSASFIHELDRLRSKNPEKRDRVIVNMINPGLCAGTKLYQEAEGDKKRYIDLFRRLFGRSAVIGARTYVHGAVVAGKQSNGKFLSDGQEAVFPDLLYTDEGLLLKTQLWHELVQELERATNIQAVLDRFLL